jgi:hypothetical protein
MAHRVCRTALAVGLLVSAAVGQSLTAPEAPPPPASPTGSVCVPSTVWYLGSAPMWPKDYAQMVASSELLGNGSAIPGYNVLGDPDGNCGYTCLAT